MCVAKVSVSKRFCKNVVPVRTLPSVFVNVGASGYVSMSENAVMGDSICK